jgi:error-prone DNA polymerase
MGPEYVELHCHSYYSLLDGASSPEALVERAVALGYPALALTDHQGLYGIVRFWQAARERGLKPIVGAEVDLAGADAGERGTHLTLLAETQRGYANLCRLLSIGQVAPSDGPTEGSWQKGHALLSWEDLAGHAEGLLCLSGCRRGLVASALLAGDEAAARRAAGRLRQIFAGCFWIEVQRHYLSDDGRLAAALVALARRMDLDLVATNDVHYARREGQRLHDVLTCIRHHTTLPEALAAGLLHPNSERFLKSPGEMAGLFGGLPGALRSTLEIAARCEVSLDFAAQRLPAFGVPPGYTVDSYLRHLCLVALRSTRKIEPVTLQAQAQLDHELGVIGRMGLAGYFLVVWDIVQFARQQGVRCQGRGSAANSLVAYLLGITPVDPLRHNLLFERFLSEGSQTMPDIDVDLAADRREEVIQYVYERYGQEHVGMVCNVVTYRARSAVREVAKALAFPPDVIDRAAKSLDTHSALAAADLLESGLPLPLPLSGEGEGEGEGDLDPDPAPSTPQAPYSPGHPSATPQLPWPLLLALLRQMDGVPRHLSIHVGGMLITAAPLVEVVPLERATMPGRVVVQWDKDSVEDAGLIKIDLLGLRTLGAVDEALRLALRREKPGRCLDLDHLPLDDPAVFQLLQRADTVGCFQVESRAQAQMLPRLRPERFEDIIVGVSLIRPGPIQGGMVHPYLRRRQGLESPTYVHPALEPILGETLGVIVFQEQVIRVAMAIAGFSPAEADRLRRALSRSNSQETLAALRERFVRGARANGVGGEAAEAAFDQIEAFAGFGFCKSHAAAFALVAYQTLYLKAHFAPEFYCALLNQQPMGFYPPEVIAGDARHHGVPILHPHVNLSQEDCTLEGEGSIRLGLRYVHGLGEAWQARIVERRGDRPFADLASFCRRTRLPRPAVENLVRAGALEGLGARRTLLWELGGLVYQEEGLDLDLPIEPAALPSLENAERLAWEYELLGMSPGDQVMALYREALQAQGAIDSRTLQGRSDGDLVRVAGWPVVRQRPPTAKGHLFITLEDEEGLMNLIVRPDVYERYRAALRNAPLLWVEGHLQREGQVLSVLVHRAAALNRA